MNIWQDIIKDLWFAPVFWPFAIFAELVFRINGWALVIVFSSIAVPLAIALTIIAAPINLLLFLGVFVAAIFAAPFQLYNNVRRDRGMPITDPLS